LDGFASCNLINGREKRRYEDNFIVLSRNGQNRKAPEKLSENTANNLEELCSINFINEITALMQNAEEVYVTGTGSEEQEQFIHYLAATPQFKNTVCLKLQAIQNE